MSEQPQLEVIYRGERMPEKPRVRFWHWIAYYIYNIARKPKVWFLKREQEQIYALVRRGLNNVTLPGLEANIAKCPTCRNAYGTLKTVPFLSSIRMLLKNMRCEEHPEFYDSFLHTYQIEFDRNEELAAEINGFKR